MVFDLETGPWIWEQDLYGKHSRHLGAGHGLSGNTFAVLRGMSHLEADLVRLARQRALETLNATAVHATSDSAHAEPAQINWHVLVDKNRIAA